ncbi:MAG TPA: hypothetical protein P5144_09100, partial [Thermoanaerobaculia bacterium]|nr:hypothetical protein [Thermoanaerobaculia bacterium]
MTVIDTGTITRLVPGPGPGSGSLLVTQRLALYGPPNSPVELNVTVTAVFVPPAFVPLAELTDSHGTSAGLAQLGFGSSAICQLRSTVPVLPTVSVWVVVVFGSCVLKRLDG